MKHFLLILFILLYATVNAQTFKLYQTDNIHNQLKLNTQTGEVHQIQDDGQTFLIQAAITPDCLSQNRYALTKTKNIWTFILLDTFYGKLWQCQFSAEGTEYMGSWCINNEILSIVQSSRFSIQPMTSMFQFYLVNDETGEMWKFQWSSKGDEYRWIVKQ